MQYMTVENGVILGGIMLILADSLRLVVMSFKSNRELGELKAQLIDIAAALESADDKEKAAKKLDPILAKIADVLNSDVTKRAPLAILGAIMLGVALLLESGFKIAVG